MAKIKIPVCEPKIGKKELEYVTDCIKSGWISSKGGYIKQFEEEFSKYCEARFGVATTSGTTALHLALTALGTRKGDEVIAPTFTMIAPINAIVYTGAKPVLVDAELQTWNMEVTKVEEKITGKTRAIVIVHTYGHPVNMGPILNLGKKYGLFVIEDAAEAHGAEYKDKKVGALGNVGCFSFYANKIVTTGEGGMIVTNNEEIAERARLLRDQAYERQRRFWHRHLGYNYRMTNLQAAVGLAQVEKIDEFVSIRRRNAYLYNSFLKDVEGISLPPEAEWAKNVYWMYSVLIEDSFGINRDKLKKILLEEYGIDTRPFFYPIHKQPLYSRKYKGQKYPIAEELSRKGINLPSSNTLRKEEIKYIADCIIQAKSRT